MRARTQDRYVVTQLEVHGRNWLFSGVFDGDYSLPWPHRYRTHLFTSFNFAGHLGETTVEHVAHHLPIIVKQFLAEAFKSDPFRAIDPAFISDLFSRSIVAFDNAIANDVLDLFGGIDGLESVSDEHVRKVINDQDRGGENFKKARLCMYGTTAIVSLIDPEHENLWIANVGDCQACTYASLFTYSCPLMLIFVLVLVTPCGPDGSGEEWTVEVLTTMHNGDNSAEIARVIEEHPDEPECVVDDRVLGALAPFRCLSYFLSWPAHR
jgi:pyruvate dehydrogenase phosphatase